MVQPAQGRQVGVRDFEAQTQKIRREAKKQREEKSMRRVRVELTVLRYLLLAVILIVAGRLAFLPGFVGKGAALLILGGLVKVRRFWLPPKE